MRQYSKSVILVLCCCLVAAACAATGPRRPPERPNAASVLFAHDFDDNTSGDYAAEWADDWRSPPWENGVSEVRTEIVDEEDAYAGKSLRIHYPAGEVGPPRNNRFERTR